MSKVSIKSKKEISQLKAGGNILVQGLQAAAKLAREAETGKQVSAWDLNQAAQDVLFKNKSEPSFLGYGGEKGSPGFPAALCVSLNNEIVHGVPQKNVFIKKGDLVKLDLGVKLKGLYTDAAVTILIGNYSDKRREIMQVTRKCLELGLEQIYPGSTLGNYGNAVEKYANIKKFHPIRGLVGHGVGYAVHEDPQVFNFGSPGEGMVLKEGMVLALEPMVNEYSSEIELASDGFCFITKKGGLSAHFECTVAVTRKGHQVLTDWFDKL